MRPGRLIVCQVLLDDRQRDALPVVEMLIDEDGQFGNSEDYARTGIPIDRHERMDGR